MDYRSQYTDYMQAEALLSHVGLRIHEGKREWIHIESKNVISGLVYPTPTPKNMLSGSQRTNTIETKQRKDDRMMLTDGMKSISTYGDGRERELAEDDWWQCDFDGGWVADARGQ